MPPSGNYGNNGYAISQNVTAALRGAAGGIPGDANTVKVIPWTYWHRQEPLGAAGTAWPASLEFFTATGNNFITNMPQANMIPSNYGLALDSVAIELTTGVSLDGTLRTAGAQSVATATPIVTVEQARAVMEHCKVEMWVGDTKIIEQIGATMFPRGAGFAISPTISNTNATTVNISSLFSNGAPFVDNRRRFPTPWPIAGGQQIRFLLSWPAAYTLTAAQGLVLGAYLNGSRFSESGN